jgi:RNA-splicing ligase RtcB
MYDALPMGTSSSVFVGKLNAETVREIRTRHAAGEKGSHLAVEFGVRPNTISDLLNNKTWRNVA